jgi:hypothetical protein
MERLRDKRNAPGSLEAQLVEAIKIDMRKSAVRRPIALAQQRNVLEAVLDRRRARNHWAKLLLRPLVVGGFLLAAGATNARTTASLPSFGTAGTDCRQADRSCGDGSPPGRRSRGARGRGRTLAGEATGGHTGSILRQASVDCGNS